MSKLKTGFSVGYVGPQQISTINDLSPSVYWNKLKESLVLLFPSTSQEGR